MICAMCDVGRLRPARFRKRMFGVDLGMFHGLRCPSCDETYLEGDQLDLLETRAKKAGIWGIGKKARVSKSGNSLVIRIPPELAKHLNLKVGAEIFVHPEGQDRIVVDVE